MTTETALDIGASKWGGTVPRAYARAMLNLLTDFSDEKIRLGDTQRAILNVLEDASVEQSRIEETQKAVLNVLEDFEMLNWKLEGRTLELSTANKELETFTYSVSHDLRAPLRHIAGFSGILLEEFGSTLEPQAQQYLQRIQEGTRKMGQLVDELLNLARLG